MGTGYRGAVRRQPLDRGPRHPSATLERDVVDQAAGWIRDFGLEHSPTESVPKTDEQSKPAAASCA